MVIGIRFSHRLVCSGSKINLAIQKFIVRQSKVHRLTTTPGVEIRGPTGLVRFSK